MRSFSITSTPKGGYLLIFTIGVQMNAVLCLIITFPTVSTIFKSSPHEDLCTSGGGILFATLPTLSLLRRLSHLQPFISLSALFEKGFPGSDCNGTSGT